MDKIVAHKYRSNETPSSLGIPVKKTTYLMQFDKKFTIDGVI